MSDLVVQSTVRVVIFQLSCLAQSTNLYSVLRWCSRLLKSYLRRQPLSWRKRMSLMLPLFMPKCTGWQVYVFFTPYMLMRCSDSLQSHKERLPFISLVSTCLQFMLGLAMPFSKLRIHLDRPILQGSPESTNSLPSAKNSTSQAGGVMKLTLMGLRMRTSCQMMALEMETTQGETGCAETAKGDDSCPFSEMHLFFTRLNSVTSLWVQVSSTSLSNWSISMMSVFWYGLYLDISWKVLSEEVYLNWSRTPLEQPQQMNWSKASTLLRVGSWLPRNDLGQTSSVGLGRMNCCEGYYQIIIAAKHTLQIIILICYTHKSSTTQLLKLHNIDQEQIKGYSNYHTFIHRQLQLKPKNYCAKRPFFNRKFQTLPMLIWPFWMLESAEYGIYWDWGDCSSEES